MLKGFHTLTLPLWKVIRLNNFHVSKFNFTPTPVRRYSGPVAGAMDPYCGSLHCVHILTVPLLSSSISLHHAISLILMASKMADTK